MNQFTPQSIRLQIREGKLKQHTSGFASGYVQCNLVILPQKYADDFHEFCLLNSQSCPLIAMNNHAGDFNLSTLGNDIDIRTDIPLYRIFENGILVNEVSNIQKIWQDDFVAFLLGCSFSFEEALIEAGIEIRNISEAKNVPMFKTNIDTQAVNEFKGKMVVSMRPIKPDDISKVFEVCSLYPKVHGAPIHVGSPEEIGISDISKPDFGDAVTVNEGEIPVFWACGVTPQLAIANAKPTICVTHSPGYMLITDILNTELKSS